ncbi:MAG: hypothetical protein ACKOD2_18905, partial [Ilumatobacteraceae bacterium]
PSSDEYGWSLDLDSPVALAGVTLAGEPLAGGLAGVGHPSMRSPLLDANNLRIILGVILLTLLLGLTWGRAGDGKARWGCQCGERPLVRAGTPNNQRVGLVRDKH